MTMKSAKQTMTDLLNPKQVQADAKRLSLSVVHIGRVKPKRKQPKGVK
jgi:hypothetical protein